MYLFTSETARTRAHVSTIAKPETLKRSMFDIPTSEEKRIKKEKINRQTLPSLQGNLLLSKNHIKTKIIPKKVSKPSRIRIVSTIVWIYKKKPNNT